MSTALDLLARRLGSLRWLGALALGALLGCGGGGGTPTEPPDDPRTPGTVDLTVNADTLAASLLLVDRTFSPNDCAVVEGAIASAGTRRLLLFDTRVENLGEYDLVIGDPSHPLPPFTSDDFEYHDCHGHFHMHGYAAYELLQDGLPVAEGSKQGFCMLDNVRVLQAARRRPQFDCEAQGLSSGYADIYARTVDGQWVDVTGVPAGDYTLRVTINAEGRIFEAVDVHPNVVEVPVTLPSPTALVAPFEDDHGDTVADPTPLVFPIALLARIELPGDVDVFRIQVVEGRQYVLALALETLPDSRLRLTNGSGTTLASNDDAGPGDPSSRIVWTASYSGWVLMHATGASGATGTYRMVVELP